MPCTIFLDMNCKISRRSSTFPDSYGGGKGKFPDRQDIYQKVINYFFISKKNKNLKISSSNKNHKVIIFSIIFQMIFFLCPLSSLFIFGAKKYRHTVIFENFLFVLHYQILTNPNISVLIWISFFLYRTDAIYQNPV